MVGILSQKEITIKLGISHTTLWRLRRSGDFPQPIQLSLRRIGWRQDEVEEYLKSRQAKNIESSNEFR